MLHQIKTNKQTNRSRSVFPFWHCAGPYVTRVENLKIACHTAHRVALGHGGGGKDCLTLNNSDTSHLYQPLLKEYFSVILFTFFKKKKSNLPDVSVSWAGGGTILPTLQRWLRYWKVKSLTQDYRVTQGSILCCSKHSGLPSAAISWGCESHEFIGCCTKKKKLLPIISVLKCTCLFHFKHFIGF